MGKNVKRLFEEIRPSHYDLRFELNIDKLAFSGTVKIKFNKTGRPSKRVTFHQKDLNIKTAKLTNLSKNQEVKLARINSQKSLDELRLHSDEMIYPGEYEAEISFNAKITKPMHGLYPCYFKVPVTAQLTHSDGVQGDGEQRSESYQAYDERVAEPSTQQSAESSDGVSGSAGKQDVAMRDAVMLATQFESHYAREVFPCVDEPEAKATFKLELDTPSGLTVLSNTPSEKQEKTGNRLVTSFEETPIMSTYLLSFVAGELHNISAKTKDGTVINTWATVAQPKKFMEYANAEAVKTLEFFTEYFQTPYPLSKCDQVALPDFEVGAMENWGLITYREVALLTDPDNRSLSSEQYISMIIAHELSHQWFGNLVTMKWWDDLWLNESFASFVEHIALNALHPDWHWWEHYVISDVLACANRDIYKDVQPVGTGVRHPDEIITLFDPAIVYAKGGRLLKMMREFIGEEAFRSGVKEYFAKNAYKNAERGDLWEALSASSKSDVSSLMTPWIERAGMPVLSVAKEGGKIKLSQERFLLDGEDEEPIWPIALLADKKLPVKLFDKKSVEIESKEPVLFNTHGSGHYLVDYNDKATREKLAKAIAQQSIPTEGRIIRLNDIILLAKADRSSLSEALDIVKKCQAEPREAVWSMMSRVIGLAKMLVEGDKQAEENIRKFQRGLAKPTLARLGWEKKPDEDPNDTLLRQTIISVSLAGEDKETIDKLLELYKSVKDLADLPAELRTTILAAVVRFGDVKEVDKLLNIYEKTNNADLKSSICGGVTEVRDEAVGKKIIKSSIGDGGFVRPQDIFRWFAYLMRNQYTRHLAWSWLTADWDRISEVFGGSKTLDYMPVYSAAPLSTAAWEKKYKEFFTPMLSNLALERNIKIGFSEIGARIEWRKREEPKLKKYFLD